MISGAGLCNLCGSHKCGGDLYGKLLSNTVLGVAYSVRGKVAVNYYVTISDVEVGDNCVILISILCSKSHAASIKCLCKSLGTCVNILKLGGVTIKLDSLKTGERSLTNSDLISCGHALVCDGYKIILGYERCGLVSSEACLYNTGCARLIVYAKSKACKRKHLAVLIGKLGGKSCDGNTNNICMINVHISGNNTISNDGEVANVCGKVVVLSITLYEIRSLGLTPTEYEVRLNHATELKTGDVACFILNDLCNVNGYGVKTCGCDTLYLLNLEGHLSVGGGVCTLHIAKLVAHTCFPVNILGLIVTLGVLEGT